PRVAIQRLKQTIPRWNQACTAISLYTDVAARIHTTLSNADTTRSTSGKLSRIDLAAWQIGVSSCRSEFFPKDANQHDSQAYSFRGVNPHASYRSEMYTPRKVRQVLAIACITPMAAFGVAACGGDK